MGDGTRVSVKRVAYNALYEYEQRLVKIQSSLNRLVDEVQRNRREVEDAMIEEVRVRPDKREAS